MLRLAQIYLLHGMVIPLTPCAFSWRRENLSLAARITAVILLVHTTRFDLHSPSYGLRAEIYWKEETHNKKSSLFL